MSDALDDNAILQTTIFNNFIDNSYEFNPLEISRRTAELLPFASLGQDQRQVSIVATTTSNKLAEEITDDISTRVDEIEATESGSIEHKIWKLLNHASIDEENLNDEGNHALAKLRAFSALQLLLETEVINEREIDQTLARMEQSTDKNAERLADNTQTGLSIKLEPEKIDGATKDAGVSIDLGFHREGEVDLIINPGNASESTLYVFELNYHEGSELNGQYEFTKEELLKLAESGHESLAEGLDAVLEAISADVNAAIDLEMDLDGRIVFAYDFFAPVKDAFSFDPRGLNKEINNWPQGSSDDQHTLGDTW